MANVEIIEVLWTLEMTAGLSFSVFNLWDSWQDYKWTRQPHVDTDVASSVAWSVMLGEAIRACELFLLTTAGIFSLFSPPAPASATGSFRNLTIGIFMFFGLLITANTAFTFVARKRLLHKLKATRPNGRSK
jgi:hypothetical protein